MRGPRLSLPRRNPTRAEDVIGVDESTAMPESMPELDQLMSALFLVALLLYLMDWAFLQNGGGCAIAGKI
jgi:hypothetical protein